MPTDCYGGCGGKSALHARTFYIIRYVCVRLLQDNTSPEGQRRCQSHGTGYYFRRCVGDPQEEAFLRHSQESHQLSGTPGNERYCSYGRHRSIVKRIGDSVKHHFVFMGVKASREVCGLPAGVVWIREGKQYMFVSSECVKDKISVHLIADEGTMTSQEMVALLYKYYPKVKSRASFLDDATPYSVNKYLGRYASYGLSCEKRFSDYKLVRALLLETKGSPNLFVTGQDILMPGIVSALSTALMTCRQVEGVTLWDTITKNDIADRLSA